MINERIEIWKKEEYHYPAAHGFIPVMFSYIHEDEKKHPAMIIAPGGAIPGSIPIGSAPAGNGILWCRVQCIRSGIYD